MATNEYELSVTAFKSEEEYKDYIEISNKIDAFCSKAKILETVAKSNKYVEATLDFCDNNGDIQNTIKLFSPILNDTLGEGEIFATIGSKVVRLGTETTFETGGLRLGTAVGTTIVELGAGTPPAWIMGTATGGSFYLGGKYISIAVGHYAEKYSYNEFLEFYDKYLQNDDNKHKNLLEVVDTENNKTTIFEPNKETTQLEPVAKVDLTTQDVIPLKEGQTVSDIAKLTNKSSVNLLEYNGITLDEAKHLPVGEPIRIYEGEPTVVTSENGNIKLFENTDGSTTAILPTQDNITYSSENDVLIHGDYTNPDSISFTSNGVFEVWQKDNNGNMYQSQVSTENLTVKYNPPDENGNKSVLNIQIDGDTTFDEVSSLTNFSKEDLQQFNLYEDDMISAGSNISTPVSKTFLNGGYGGIVNYTTQDGQNIFIVPQEDGSSITYGTFTDGFENQAVYDKSLNGSIDITLTNEDGSTRVIIANNDGYSFDSYGLEGKVDIEYERLGNDELIVKSLHAKEDLDIESFSLNSSLNKEQIAFLNSIDNSGGKILKGQSIILPEGKIQYVDSAYGKVIIQKTTDGNSIFIVPNSDVTSTTYGTFTDGFENQVYCEKEVA